jgi:hypothetical protein
MCGDKFAHAAFGTSIKVTAARLPCSNMKAMISSWRKFQNKTKF